MSPPGAAPVPVSTPGAGVGSGDLTPRERAILIELWLQGVGAPKLSRAFDVSQHEVYRLVREGA